MPSLRKLNHFKDYSGECFKTGLTNPVKPVGRKKMLNNGGITKRKEYERTGN